MTGKFLFGALLAALVAVAHPAASQTYVLEGFQNCMRATNGRPYCQRPGSENYFSVTEAFFTRFERSREAAAARPQTVTQNNTINTTVNNTVIIQRLETEAAELRGMADLFRTIIREQSRLAATASACRGVAAQTTGVLNARLRAIQESFVERTTELSRYVTSIRPNDPDLRITARRASEIYPKVPFYIPGSPETGEFWLEPNVTETGELTFNLKFIDTGSAIDKVRGTIPMTQRELEITRDALCKLTDWSVVAHENRVHRNISKRVVCFPEARCPAEGAKREGVASTEIVFSVQEDGRTAGRIQRNRGRFEDGYNISIESALLLQAYLNHILSEGTQEFDARTRSTEEVRDLFK